MAITVTQLPGGTRARKWNVTWALDADTVATINHGLVGIPDLVVGPTPLNAAAYIGQVARTNVTSSTIVLTKNVVGGSGGASVEVTAFLPLSIL